MYKNILTLWLITLVMVTSWIPVRIAAQADIMTGPLSGEGYVVLNNGDTLNGRINWRMKYVENNPVEIKFIPENGSARIFNASEITACGSYPENDFESSIQENYVSMPSFKKGVPVFLNRLLDGRIKVFQNRSSVVIKNEKAEVTTEFDGIEFRFSRDGGLTIGPTYKTSYRIIESRTRYSSYFVTKDKGTLLKIEKDNFDSSFSDLFGDCPDIQKELDKNPDLRKFKNFMLLTEVYNQICGH